MATARQDSLSRQRQLPQQQQKRKRNIVLRTRRKTSDPRPWRHLLLLLIMMAGVALLLLSRYTQETVLSFQLEEEQQELRDAINEYERLYMELGQSGSLEFLEKRAAALGFRPADSSQYVRLVPEKTP